VLTGVRQDVFEPEEKDRLACFRFLDPELMPGNPRVNESPEEKLPGLPDVFSEQVLYVCADVVASEDQEEIRWRAVERVSGAHQAIVALETPLERLNERKVTLFDPTSVVKNTFALEAAEL